MHNSAKIRLVGCRPRIHPRERVGRLAVTRPGSALLAHLSGMNDYPRPPAGLEPVLTTSELAAHLGVSVQAIHDLRHAGRGPRGFRVGRELRYRLSEVQHWLVTLEDADEDRHRVDRADS